MDHTEVAIIGAGIAGASAAAVMGRRGIPCVVFDATSTDRPDFRCEKVDQTQLDRLAMCGLDDVFSDASLQNRTLWVGRGGRVVERTPYLQATSPYEGMVATMRGAISGSAQHVASRVVRVETSDTLQTLHLADGSVWTARLVVVATGPSPKLVRALGFERRVLSQHHSISIGFDIHPSGTSSFPFESVTWFPERFDGATAYITVFRMGDHWRANLFVYRPVRDPWLERMKADPVGTLTELMPGFVRLAGAVSIPGPVRVRSVDLYETVGAPRPGIVLVGDAFATSDPAAGTGFDKVWSDVHRLVNGHIEGWLATPGMGVDKVGAFYADREKRECDAWCRKRAFDSRSLATSTEPYWRLRRRAAWAVQTTRGAVRSVVSPLR